MDAMENTDTDMPLDLTTRTRTPDRDVYDLRRASSSSIELISLLTKDGGKRNPCHFCGIGFSSPKTLEAHQNFYCAKKHELQNQDVPRKIASPLVVPEIRRQSITTTATYIPDVPDITFAISQAPANRPYEVRVVSPISQSTGQSMVEQGPRTGNFCVHCPFRANTIRGLRSHMTKCHFRDTSSSLKTTKDTRTRTVSTGRSTASVAAPKRPKIDGVCPAVSGGFAEKKKHCKYCDISFKYLSTFLAHRKYYCSVRKVEGSKEGADVDKDKV